MPLSIYLAASLGLTLTTLILFDLTCRPALTLSDDLQPNLRLRANSAWLPSSPTLYVLLWEMVSQLQATITLHLAMAGGLNIALGCCSSCRLPASANRPLVTEYCIDSPWC